MQKNVSPAEALCEGVVHGRACPSMPGGERGCRLFINQTMLVMKLTMVLLTASILTANATGFSQNVTFSGKHVNLLKIFSAIETQTGYYTVGSLKLLNEARPVSIDVKGMPLESFLKLVLKDQPIDFSISEKTIFLSRKPGDAASAPPVVETRSSLKVSGQVLGVNGVPLANASVGIEEVGNVVLTNTEGRFELYAEKGQILIFSYVGYKTAKWKVTGERMKIELKPADNKLEDVEVVINTGYQKFKPNEMVGAVEVITAKDLQRQVGTNILKKLQGLSAALQFNNKVTPSSSSGNPNSKLNINIRGWSTINGPTDPLIILDNFPYQGDINNINPNDVESVVILKDAAATSIWGARAGNGVIVINTRRGKYSSKTTFNFSSELSVTEKPRLHKLPLISSASYIDQELRSANANINSLLGQKEYTFTPAVNVILDRKRGLISAEDSAAKIDYLKSIDSRQQWNKYIYRPAIKQYYTVNASGGSTNMAWDISGTYIRTKGTTQNQDESGQIAIGNRFRVNSKIELLVKAQYNMAKSRTGGPEFNSIQSRYYSTSRIIPYMQLADERGAPVSLLKKYSQAVLDTLGRGLLLDYSYYPLTDWQHDYTTTKLNNTLLTAALSYRPVSGLQLELMVNAMKENSIQNNIRDKESFFTRDLINKFSQVDPITRVINRVVPIGDVLMQRNTNNNNLSVRAQGTYIEKWGKHGIHLMASLDMSENKLRTDGQILLGYSEDPLLYSIVNMTDQFPVPFEGSTTVAHQLEAQSVLGIRSFVQRLASVLASASYTYDNRYIFYSSLRKDGANILGVRANDRWKPLWSIGGSWIIDREKFFKVKWISGLTFRSTVGISGNVDVTRSSNPVGSITQGLPNTTLPYPYLQINTPPNPNLRWEKNMQIDWAMDVSFLKGRISATTGYYIKRNRDLYGQLLADYTQSPASLVTANYASMDGSGFEVRLSAQIFQGTFSWNSIFSFAKNTEKVKNYYNQMEPGASFFQNLTADGNSINEKMTLFPGQPLFSLAGVRTAGVSNTGQVLYLVDGKPTPNFGDVIKDFELHGNKASSYVFFGSTLPKFNFNFNNVFNWKNWNLTVMAQCKFGYYFKKPMITNSLGSDQPVYHKDYELRWQKPGDELHTNIPSVQGGMYFYSSMSADLIKKADHIRIGNMQLSYNFSPRNNNAGFKNLMFALNLSDLGPIWVANKEGLDPEYDGASDFMTYKRPNRMLTLTVRAGF